MGTENRVSEYVLTTQVSIFADARRDLQLPLKVIAADSTIPYPTIVAYAEGRHAMSIAALKLLLRVDGMAPLLSRLFEPEDHSLVTVGAATDHDTVIRVAVDLMAATVAAHHPDSEMAEKISPNEHRQLNTKRTALRAVA